jgi:hypothetical protein
MVIFSSPPLPLLSSALSSPLVSSLVLSCLLSSLLHHTDIDSSTVTETAEAAIEAKETAQSRDLQEPLKAIELEQEREREKVQEREQERVKRPKAGPGTIIYPDKAPAATSVTIPASVPAPVASTTIAAGRRSLVIITGERRRGRGKRERVRKRIRGREEGEG